MSNILIVHLNKEFYDMVISGKKRIEYRECKEYWCKRFANNHYDYIKFVLGYNPKCSFLYKLDKIEIISYNDLPKYAQDFFINSIYPKFYTIHFSNLTLKGD